MAQKRKWVPELREAEALRFVFELIYTDRLDILFNTVANGKRTLFSDLADGSPMKFKFTVKKVESWEAGDTERQYYGCDVDHYVKITAENEDEFLVAMFMEDGVDDMPRAFRYVGKTGSIGLPVSRNLWA